ncbi:MAG: EamA family transporter [Chloroflexi bacterium]|nr:EamA family transporter [Chloroflexota bacterium]
MRQFVLIVVTVVLNVVGQMAMKRGMNAVGAISLDVNKLPAVALRTFTEPYVLLGIAAYGLSSVFWLVILSRVDLSYAYPALSLGYVLIVIISWLLLNESVSASRLIGVLVVCSGVLLVARS